MRQAEFETTTEFGGDDETDEEFHRLAFFAGDEGEEPALWAAPVVLLVVLAACAVLVASRSRDRTQVVRDLAVWCALLLVAVPWLIRLANLHGSGTYDFDGGDEGFSGEAEFDGFVGLAGGQATFLIFLIAIVVAVVVALARGGFRGVRLPEVFARLQQNPSRPPPPPSYPPPPPYDGSPTGP